ncbi:hypothetical protein ACFT8P_28285 [Streptomyces sp. NPDC057101]|uniref:hypothetical protein n=1 Tax=Streptomyces sp. NPDC057101 TaxID=3346020 RepID=UPI003641694A
MSRRYIVAHGAYIGDEHEVLLPDGHEQMVRFYAQPGDSIDVGESFAMMFATAQGREFNIPPTPQTVPNYYLGKCDDMTLVRLTALLHGEPGIEEDSVQILGYHLPDRMRLCGDPLSSGCSQGEHSCDGLLGVFRGIPIDISCCRIKYGDKTTHVSDPAEYFDEASYEVLKRWIDHLEGEAQPYSGDFARWFDLQGQKIQSYVLTHPDLARWQLRRAAWSASNGFKDGAALGVFMSLETDHFNIQYYAICLGEGGEFTYRLDKEQLALARGVHLFRTNKERFIEEYRERSEETRRCLNSYPGIAAWAWLELLKQQKHPYSNGFPATFDSLPDDAKKEIGKTKAGMAWQHGRVWWKVTRAAMDGEALGEYLASAEMNATTMHIMSELGKNTSYLVKRLGPGQTVLARGVYIFLSNRSAFADHYALSNAAEREILCRHEGIDAWDRAGRPRN